MRSGMPENKGIITTRQVSRRGVAPSMRSLRHRLCAQCWTCFIPDTKRIYVLVCTVAILGRHALSLHWRYFGLPHRKPYSPLEREHRFRSVWLQLSQFPRKGVFSKTCHRVWPLLGVSPEANPSVPVPFRNSRAPNGN